MRPLSFVGPAILVAGLATLAIAFTRGEADLYLILVIPVIVGTGPLALLGILLVFVGFFLTFLFWNAGAIPPVPLSGAIPNVSPTDAPGHRTPSRRWGGVVFLGPIPLVFGSCPQMGRVMLLLGVVLFVALLVVTIAFLLA